MKQRSRSTQTEITFIHFSLLHIRIVHDPNWMSFSRSNLKHYNSLSHASLLLYVLLSAACVCVSHVVNGIVNSIMKKNYTSHSGEGKKRERFESKLMFFACQRQCEFSEAWQY